MATWALGALSAALAGLVMAEYSRAQHATQRWAEVYADHDALVAALDAGRQDDVTQLCGRQRAREKFARPPVGARVNAFTQ
jgi:DNA-binding FadR family transcriptional regulator